MLLLLLKIHSLRSATVNNAAYSTNLAFKFHSLEVPPSVIIKLAQGNYFSVHFIMSNTTFCGLRYIR